MCMYFNNRSIGLSISVGNKYGILEIDVATTLAIFFCMAIFFYYSFPYNWD